MKTAIFFVLVLLSLAPAHASAVITLDGKLDSFDDRLVIIRRQGALFYIETKFISPEVLKSLKAVDQPVRLELPAEAVKTVRDAPKKPD